MSKDLDLKSLKQNNGEMTIEDKVGKTHRIKPCTISGRDYYVDDTTGDIWTQKRGVYKEPVIRYPVVEGVPIHRIIATACHGQKPTDTSVIRHKDDDPFNNLPSNLVWGTAQQNYFDKIRNSIITAYPGLDHEQLEYIEEWLGNGGLSEYDIEILRQTIGAEKDKKFNKLIEKLTKIILCPLIDAAKKLKLTGT